MAPPALHSSETAQWQEEELRSLQCQSIRHLFHQANVGLWFGKTSGTWLSIPWSFKLQTKKLYTGLFGEKELKS